MPWLITLANGQQYKAVTFTHTNRNRPVLRLNMGTDRPPEWIEEPAIAVEWVDDD